MEYREVSRLLINEENTHKMLIGDFNVCPDMEMDRDIYRGDYRKGSRIIINSWIKNRDLNDVFRDYHPEKRAFTWYRSEVKLIVQKGRMDLFYIWQQTIDNNIILL